MENRVLLACPRMKALAEKVKVVDPSIEIGEIEWKRFPDGFPDIFIKGMDGLIGKDVAFLAAFDSPDVVFEQLSVMYALAAARPKSLRILLPYFPTGTMERVDHEGQVATASTLAQAISAVAPSGPGPVPLFMWDVHALPIRHYFGPNVAPRFKTGTKLLKSKLEGREVVIAFPDEGAWKRFRAMFDGSDGKPSYPMAVCRKVRDGESRRVTLSEGDVRGKEVVIVDDLIHSGGTIVECLKALKEAGAAKVSAYATHGVLEHGAWKKFLDAGFDRVWITDSVPAIAAEIDGQGPFEVLSLAPSIAKALL